MDSRRSTVRLQTRRDRLGLPSRHTRQNPRDRSIVVPLRAIALNLLAVAASTGVLVFVFQPKWIVWPGPQFGTAPLSDDCSAGLPSALSSLNRNPAIQSPFRLGPDAWRAFLLVRQG